MREYKGEVWKIYRLDYEAGKWEDVGEMYVEYEEIYKWLEGRKRLTGVTREWLRRYAEEHGLVGETLVCKVVRYVRR